MDNAESPPAGPPTRKRARILSMAPGAAFLKQLAGALVDGRLIEGFRPLDDPIALASATIYLPTRRAARALSAEFIDAMGGRAALLPVIRTLGDAEEDEFEPAADLPEAELAPAIGELERRLLLARLVRTWSGALSQETRRLYGDEDIVVPSSAAEALRMAGDLCDFLDTMETEEVAWSRLPDLVRDASDFDAGPAGDWAQWWNVTLKFLAIVGEHWPDYLAAAGRLDPSQRRRALLDARARRLEADPRGGPVIAAGSTGSIPATARLLGAVARHSAGAVVLPGLDHGLDERIWRALGRDDPGGESLASHPQYGLARLLAGLGVDRKDVEPLQETGERMALIGAAMLPPEETGAWAGLAGDIDRERATQGLAILEAPNERLEALAIAIALRETLETPGRTAALVTPDRTLARRVAAELGRFGLAIDDSAGMPLGATTAGRVARLIAAAGAGPADPVALATLAKSPAISGPPDGVAQRAARLFELAVLRGAVTVPVSGALAAAAAGKQARPDRRPPAEVAAMLPDDWLAVTQLCDRLDRTLAPLVALRDAGAAAPLEVWIGALRQAIALADGGGDLFGATGGAELARLLEAPDLAGDSGFAVRPDEFPDVLAALLEGVSVRGGRRAHPRLAILGPLEARLQKADLMILGGLNEGSWPSPTRNDPFLNRPMKAQIGLSAPERRIGQAAHDFQQLSGCETVLYTRPLKSANAPTVASRWLQRLQVAAGAAATAAMMAAGRRLLDLAGAIDASEGRIERTSRPNPKPPVALRPRRLSVTQIETWIRDPYAIHARHILGLQALPPLERQADPLLRGQLYHRILARFVSEPEQGSDHARIMRIASECFAEENVPAEVAAVWLPRFAAIARLFVEWESARRADVAVSAVETGGRIEVGATGFTLTGVADRIDALRDGRLAILDYKTGSGPSKKQARTLSPQLALEARMAELGAFAGVPKDRGVADLAYVRLRAAQELEVERICEGKGAPSPAQLIDTAWQRLEGLIALYMQPGQGYLSRYAPLRESAADGEYDHLARVREWSAGDEEDAADD